MPLFLAVCTDKTTALEARLAARAAHLDYLHARPQTVMLGGPFSNDAGEMAGSMMILEVPDKAAALAFIAADPYALAGVFESVVVRPWRRTAGSMPPWAPPA